MAKLNRERGLVERRLEKQARKAARKQAATHQEQAPGASPAEADPGQRAVDAAAQALGDMAKVDAREPGETSS